MQHGFLVGDRGVDMATPRDQGLGALGATYGFSGEQKLKETGVEILFDPVPTLDAGLALLLDPVVQAPFTRPDYLQDGRSFSPEPSIGQPFARP